MTRNKSRLPITLIHQYSPLLNHLLRIGIILITVCYLTACKKQIDGMLDPIGMVAYEERKLFFDTLALMLIVVLPVIVMSLTFVYHYKVSHRIRDYKPNWSHSYFLESLWWGIPSVIIIVLAVITWKKTQELDPYHNITGHNEPPLIIQAIALPWKWLFIYPQQNIATVNFLEIPINQQIEFWITADNVPMSAFFIPRLGSQIYAMEGMRTRLFLLANETSDTIGLNTLFNGAGFAEMHFTVHIVKTNEMQQWVNQIKKSAIQLTEVSYSNLLISSVDDKPQFFNGVPSDFFNTIINTYIHSNGIMHPREQQAKFNYLVKQEG